LSKSPEVCGNLRIAGRKPEEIRQYAEALRDLVFKRRVHQPSPKIGTFFSNADALGRCGTANKLDEFTWKTSDMMAVHCIHADPQPDSKILPDCLTWKIPLYRKT
jgi:hypothetical protein